MGGMGGLLFLLVGVPFGYVASFSSSSLFFPYYCFGSSLSLTTLSLSLPRNRNKNTKLWLGLLSFRDLTLLDWGETTYTTTNSYHLLIDTALQLPASTFEYDTIWGAVSQPNEWKKNNATKRSKRRSDKIASI